MSVYKVRVCPVCGTENSASASDCSKCKADILGEPLESRFVKDSEATAGLSPPAPATASGDGRLILEVLQDPGLSFAVSEGQTVGRSDLADVVLDKVPNSDYISRRMAIFTRRGKQWFVQHLANTNYITVDGERYDSDEEIALHNGSILGLALCQFTVRIED